MYVRFLKESDRDLPAAERRVEFTPDPIQPEDLREFQPVRRYLDDSTADALAAGGTLEHTHQWSRWEQIQWCAAWFLSGMGAMALIVAAINHYTK